jgi:hypothetical protein
VTRPAGLKPGMSQVSVPLASSPWKDTSPCCRPRGSNSESDGFSLPAAMQMARPLRPAEKRASSCRSATRQPSRPPWAPCPKLHETTRGLVPAFSSSQAQAGANRH